MLPLQKQERKNKCTWGKVEKYVNGLKYSVRLSIAEKAVLAFVATYSR